MFHVNITAPCEISILVYYFTIRKILGLMQCYVLVRTETLCWLAWKRMFRLINVMSVISRLWSRRKTCTTSKIIVVMPDPFRVASEAKKLTTYVYIKEWIIQHLTFLMENKTLKERNQYHWQYWICPPEILLITVYKYWLSCGSISLY